MSKVWKRIISFVVALALIMPVGMEWTKTRSEATEWVKVKGTNVVVDSITVNGVTVNAYYTNESYEAGDAYYSCAAFVSRFYREVYGVTVNNLWNGSSVPNVSEGSFSKTSSPQIGDIVRWNSKSHWAIVKEVKNDGKYYVIEQSYHWTDRDGDYCGGKNRELSSSDDVTLFRWSGAGKKDSNSTFQTIDDIFENVGARDVTKTEAIIFADLKTTHTVSNMGFTIGNKSDLSDGVTHYETEKYTVKSGHKTKNIWYGMNKWYGQLKPDTRYYYRIFIVEDGVTKSTSIRTFTTLSGDSQNYAVDDSIFSIVGDRDKTETEAVIYADLYATHTVSNIGFTIGLKADLSDGVTHYETEKYTVESGHKTKSIWYSMNKWFGTLTPGTTYYYRIFIVENGKTISCSTKSFQSLKKTVPLKSISLSKSSLTLEKGKSETLSVSFNPNDTTDSKSVTWSSSDTKVATVDKSGKITAVGAGTATITATSSVSGISPVSCEVTVEDRKLKAIKLSKEALSLKVGDSENLSVSYDPEDTSSSKDIIWSSSNTNVATVDINGKITAIGKGSATITAVSAIEGVNQAECILVVEEKSTFDVDDDTLKKFICAYYGDDPDNGLDCDWKVSDNKSYWFENGVRQGTFFDRKGVIGDGSVRGREICDMRLTDETNQQGVWFWLDSVYDGAKAIGKEVWIPYIYQNEADWDDAKKREIANESDEGMRDLVYTFMKEKKGKWVRYDENGGMLKGWVTIEGALAEKYTDQVGNTYYYDSRTGLMAKGHITINSIEHYFDDTTGALKW